MLLMDESFRNLSKDFKEINSLNLKYSYITGTTVNIESISNSVFEKIHISNSYLKVRKCKQFKLVHCEIYTSKLMCNVLMRCHIAFQSTVYANNIYKCYLDGCNIHLKTNKKIDNVVKENHIVNSLIYINGVKYWVKNNSSYNRV